MENKTLTIIKLILLALIGLLLTTILIVLLVRPSKGINFFRFNSKSTLVYQKEISESIKKIEITTKAADIEIENSHSDQIEVKYYGEEDNKESISLTTDNEILNINEDASDFCIGFCNYAEHKIVISVPNATDYQLDLNTASGDVSIPSIEFSDISIKTISGDIKVNSATKAKLETTSGDIELSEVNDLTTKTISGDISINQIKNSCDIKTTSGDIEIEILKLAKDSKITTISGEVDVDTNIGSYVKTETVSGEVDIKNNDRYAKTELTVKTTSGDIEVGD